MNLYIKPIPLKHIEGESRDWEYYNDAEIGCLKNIEMMSKKNRLFIIFNLDILKYYICVRKNKNLYFYLKTI